MKYIVTIYRISYVSNQKIDGFEKKLLRIMSQGQLFQTKDIGTSESIDNTISWDDTFQITLENKWKQHTIQFEIQKQHTFGFNREELLGVLKGEINLRLFEEKRPNYQCNVYNLKKDAVVRSFENAYLRSRSLKTERMSTENPQIKLMKNMSIITFYEADIKNLVDLSNCYVTLKVGPRIKSTSTTKHRENVPIWVQTLSFKRENQQNLELSIMITSQNQHQMRFAYGVVDLNEIQIKQHVVSHKIAMIGRDNTVIGSCFIDIKAKTISKPTQRYDTQKSIIEIDPTNDVVLSRRSSSNQNVSSYFNNLPSLHSSRLISPKLTKQVSVIHSNQNIPMSKSQRFISQVRGKSPVSGYLDLFGKNTSDFNLPKRKHGNIGHGKKTDFSRHNQYVPGVGEYKLPSLFDRYR